MVPSVRLNQRRGRTNDHVMASVGTAGCWLERAIEGAMVLTLIAELVVVFTNIVLRSLFGIGLDWVQEVSQIALVFLTFVGGALAYRRGAHMRVHAGIQALPERARPYVSAAVDATIFAVALIVTWQSADRLALGGQSTTPMLGLPTGWMTAPLTVGMLVMALFAFGRLFSYPSRVALPAVAGVAAALAIALTRGAVGQDQALVITLVVFAVLLAMSTSIGFVFAAVSLLYLQQTKMVALTSVAVSMQYGTSSFVMLSVPFFILAGLVMTEAGLALPMSEFLSCVVGRLRGGLLQVIVVTMYVFSGISGSKVADMVAVGTSLSAMLKRGGYPKGETAAVLACSAAMGETVPPSIAMLVLGSVVSISIGGMFIAGILPAALIALCLMAAIYLRAGRLGLGQAPAIPWRHAARRGIVAIPAFAMPAMLLAGILTGISTATEVSSFAVVYGLIMAVLVYRTTNGKGLWRVMSESVTMTGNILFVVSAAMAFSRAITLAQVPVRLASVLDVFQGEPWLFMLACVFFLIVMGAFLEGFPAMLVLSPILFPIVTQFGIPELQFAIVLIIAMGIGFFSPPIGIGIYFACSVAEATMEDTLRPMLYYVSILIVGVLLVAFLPEVSLALPRLAGMSVH